MSKKTLRYSLNTLPLLTEGQRLHLEELASHPDDRINPGDIPELTDDQLSEMRPARPRLRLRKGQTPHDT